MSEKTSKQHIQAIDIANALKQDFATTVNRIYINSLNRDVGFREITVTQQKTLSRIMIENENRKDVIFDAQCALINEVCLEKDTFDIYQCSEFDRLKLLIALYQANMFKNNIEFTCPNCGTQNSFKLDFSNVLKKLDVIDLQEKTFGYENKLWQYDFVLEYPKVKRVQEFHKANISKYRGLKKQQIKTVDNLQNMEYINLFIKTLTITNKTNNTDRVINFNDFEAGDIEQILSVFPQDVLYADDGVLKFIVTEYIKKINDSFDSHECFQCGTKYENDISNADSFL